MPVPRRGGERDPPPTGEGAPPTPRMRGIYRSIGKGYPHLGMGVCSRHSLDGNPRPPERGNPSLGKGGPLCPSDEAVPLTRQRAPGPRKKGTRSSASGYPSLEKAGRRTDHGNRASGQGAPRASNMGYPSIGNGAPVPRRRANRPSRVGSPVPRTRGAAAPRKRGTRGPRKRGIHRPSGRGTRPQEKGTRPS